MKRTSDLRSHFLEGTAVLAIALAVRLAGIGQDAGGDELYHILAAHQYLVDGSLSINGAAPYTRGEVFTLLIAWLFRWLGESPVVARIPSLVAGSLTALVVFLWLRSLEERSGAWVAGLLVAFEPDLIKLSQWARFYTLQHLSFLVGAIAVFTLLSGPRKPARVVSLGLAALASFWFALHLQVITRIGILGLGIYACVVGVPALVSPARRERRFVLPVVLAAAALGGILLALRLGVLEDARRLATEVDLWAAGSARDWRYYHALLQESYPTFWPIFPLLLLVCAAAQPRLALLCGSVFGTAFLAHSLVAMKHPRYVSYVLPFFLIPCGVAAARLCAGAASMATSVGALWLTRRQARVCAWIFLGAAVPFAVLANPAFMRTARLIAFDPTFRQPGMEHEGLAWGRAAARLRPVVENAEVVVSSEDLSALYYLGRLDYAISATQLDLEKTGIEFTPDQSTAVPLVSRPASLDRILRCHASGVIVARTWALHTDWAVPPETAAYIESHATAIPLPKEWGVEAFVWRTPVAEGGEDCPSSGTIRAAPAR